MHRNERLFSNVNPEANRISQLLRDIVEMNTHLVTFPCFNNPRFLHPPEQNMDSVPGFFGVYLGLNHLGSPQHIILFDAAWKKETRVMGCAWVVHTPSSSTQMENGGGTYGLASSALHAESQAFLKALIWAHSHGLQRISFFTDCTNLIMALKYPMDVPSSVYWTIRDIKLKAASFCWYFLLKVNRQQVQRVHDTAQLCARTCLQFTT